MVKLVLTHRSNSTYDDRPDTRYHFPDQYLRAMREAVGDEIVYYEPRRNSGRQCYFAIAHVDRIEPDRELPGHYYARLSCYLDLDRPVSFRSGDRTVESSQTKADGSANAGAFGWSVRRIPEREFEQILTLGFAPVLQPVAEWARTDLAIDHVAEEQLEWNPRPLIEKLMTRPFRDAAFAHRVREAYDNTCAISGLKLVNVGGRSEVQAAHIRPVASGGPDFARNGLALGGTVHWMFDRGLLSVDEESRLLVASDEVVARSAGLIRPGHPLLAPKDASARPHPDFLSFHRANIFKGSPTRFPRRRGREALNLAPPRPP